MKKPKKFYKKTKEKTTIKKSVQKETPSSINHKQTNPDSNQHHKQESPKKTRAIAEHVILLTFIAIVSLIGIVLLMGQIKIYYVQLEKIEKEKKHLEMRYARLEELAILHPGAKDIYLHLANISYQLNNKEKAQVFTERALILDPNDKNALRLKEIFDKKSQEL